MLQPAADAIGDAVAARLRGESATLGAADGRDATAMGVAAHLSGTGPLLGYWVEEGMLDVSDPLATVLARHIAHARLRAKRITHGVTPALARLVAGGVTPVVIKGFHTSRTYFAEPALRPMADVDVIVATDEIPRAEEILSAAGFTPSPIIERPYKRDWYPPDDDGRLWSFEVFHERDRWKLELHDGVSFGYLARFGLRLDGGVQSGTTWHVGDVPVRVPTQPLLTAMLATHHSVELHASRLLRLVELTFVIRRDRELGTFAWDSFEALLDTSGTRRFVYPALSLVERLAPGTIDAGVLSRTRGASTRLTRLVAERITPTCPILEERRDVAERFMWTANGREVVQRIAHWLNPVPGAPWRDIRDLYHGRVRRLLSGRVSWAPVLTPPRRPGESSTSTPDAGEARH